MLSLLLLLDLDLEACLFVAPQVVCLLVTLGGAKKEKGKETTERGRKRDPRASRSKVRILGYSTIKCWVVYSGCTVYSYTNKKGGNLNDAASINQAAGIIVEISISNVLRLAISDRI